MRLRIDDLPAEQIRAALSIDPTELPFEEALAIEDFLDRIGGIENWRCWPCRCSNRWKAAALRRPEHRRRGTSPSASEGRGIRAPQKQIVAGMRRLPSADYGAPGACLLHGLLGRPLRPAVSRRWRPHRSRWPAGPPTGLSPVSGLRLPRPRAHRRPVWTSFARCGAAPDLAGAGPRVGGLASSGLAFFATFFFAIVVSLCRVAQAQRALPEFSKYSNIRPGD